MTDEEQRASRREYKRRWRAANPEKWREQRNRHRRSYYERNKEKLTAKVKKWLAAHPERRAQYEAAAYVRYLARMKSDPDYRARINETKRRSNERRDPGLAARRVERVKERERRAAERAAKPKQVKLSPEEAKARRLERYRRQARRYRRLYPDRKREQDRRYRAENPEKARAGQLRRKERARLTGARQTYDEKYAAAERRLTEAIQVLRERGILPPIRWGARTDRDAAREFARELGLLSPNDQEQ